MAVTVDILYLSVFMMFESLKQASIGRAFGRILGNMTNY